MKIITYVCTDPDAVPPGKRAVSMFLIEGAVLAVLCYGEDIPSSRINAEGFWSNESERQRRLTGGDGKPMISEARAAGLSKAREAAAEKRRQKKAAE